MLQMTNFEIKVTFSPKECIQVVVFPNLKSSSTLGEANYTGLIII